MSASVMMQRRADGLDGQTLLGTPSILAALAAMDEVDREVFVDRVVLAEQWESIEARLEISRGQRVYRWNRARGVIVSTLGAMEDAA